MGHSVLLAADVLGTFVVLAHGFVSVVHQLVVFGAFEVRAVFV